MKLPSKTIKIGYRIYQVEEWTEQDSQANEKTGLCDKSGGVIFICVDQDDRQIANTFIHEVLHALYWDWGIEDSDEEERIVTILANGLTTVWVDNKTWFDWLKEMLK